MPSPEKPLPASRPVPAAGAPAPLVGPILAWYRRCARELPWRAADAGPWAVLVSEVMLQQTPVARVLPTYDAWLRRWPTPPALAAEPAGEAVRMWGRLGYPRRALRLHASATVIRDAFGGLVPRSVDELLALPGVGAYTARAVAAFAFGARVPVVDTNVRRVLARAVLGQGEAGPPSAVRDQALVTSLLPTSARRAALFSVGLMELGALVCTARAPRCGVCPIRDRCVWQRVGAPPYAGRRGRPQRFAGTDRQVRGLLLAVVRNAPGPVGKAALDAVWPDAGQRERALGTLVRDGLLHPRADASYALP